MKPSIFIALPTYREQMDADTTVSLMRLCYTLATERVGITISKLDHSPVDETRNLLASWFLTKSQMTHMLFADSDICFNPSAVTKLVGLGVDVSACVIPKRKGGTLNVVGLDQATSTCERIGTGLMLVSRAALDKIAPSVRKIDGAVYKVEQYSGQVYGFFDRMIHEGTLLSEDYSFCQRWRATGGTIHAVTDEPTGHVARTVLTHTGP